ncbi:hypothetical protein CYLTODRAFT_421653 [Cylindrobasidium torrendii FP15055 ss-10]|uniref:DUF7704 domain-containing protein n=1 Tax=Cylindrobasidium torrendii FP15055 ss-10 TaxID=1314674 RepID=A0A0D7BD34_9AGAR|nr:hypothetical protein CYLTODRAFT_421653 [Cylindrobasidium torrendii FP15055 ss-10]
MSAIPSPYRMFFLYIEPIVDIAAAYYTACNPSEYLTGQRLASSIQPIVIPTTQTTIALEQLGNLYLFLALNQHFVLSSTTSITTWRRLLLALLVADFGHLASMRGLGIQIYWNAWEWNVLTAGSVLLVYICALLRICFLLGVGMGKAGKAKAS